MHHIFNVEVQRQVTDFQFSFYCWCYQEVVAISQNESDMKNKIKLLSYSQLGLYGYFVGKFARDRSLRCACLASVVTDRINPIWVIQSTLLTEQRILM